MQESQPRTGEKQNTIEEEEKVARLEPDMGLDEELKQIGLNQSAYSKYSGYQAQIEEEDVAKPSSINMSQH